MASSTSWTPRSSRLKEVILLNNFCHIASLPIDHGLHDHGTRIYDTTRIVFAISNHYPNANVFGLDVAPVAPLNFTAQEKSSEVIDLNSRSAAIELTLFDNRN
jgi:hypothetical protein